MAQPPEQVGRLVQVERQRERVLVLLEQAVLALVLLAQLLVQR